MDSLGKIKGVAFSEFLFWYQEQYGSERILELIARLPTDARFAFDVSRPVFGVLASRWYPAEIVHLLIDGVIIGYSEQELARMATEASTFIMSRTLRGVYKTMFSMLATPPRYLRYAQRMWDIYYDSGVLTGEEVAPGAHRFTNRNWRAHHPFICRMNNQAGVPIYTAMGCKRVRIEDRHCLVYEGDGCGSTIYWQR